MKKTKTIKGLLGVSGLTLLLQGCAIWDEYVLGEKEQAVPKDPDYPYINAQQAQMVKVPQGKKDPLFSDRYNIPGVAQNNTNTDIGADLDITSPRLVLPVVSGSRIMEGSREAVVQFDQVNDDQPLETSIWNSLVGYLEERGIGVVEFNKDENTLKTDWMIIEKEDDSAWYSWTKTERHVGERFEFRLDVKSHGRSATLYAKLVEYLETVDEKVIEQISDSKVRSEEIEVLNDVISHYEKQLRLADYRKIKKIQRGMKTDAGFNGDGDSAYIVSGDYEITWPRLLLVLRKLGFNVKDLDKSTGLIFVNYVGIDEGWWDGLFSSADELPVPKGNYRIFVAEQGDKTSITFKDDDNEPMSPQLVAEMYPLFAEVMNTDDLDI